MPQDQQSPSAIQQYSQLRHKNIPQHSPTSPACDPPAEFFQNAIIHAGIPVVSLDAMGRIISWNTAAVLLFGRNEADALGRPLEILIPTEFRSAANLAFQRTMQQRSVNTYEMSIFPEGGRRPVHVGVTLSCVTDTVGPAGGGGGNAKRRDGLDAEHHQPQRTRRSPHPDQLYGQRGHSCRRSRPSFQ